VEVVLPERFRAINHDVYPVDAIVTKYNTVKRENTLGKIVSKKIQVEESKQSFKEKLNR